LDPFDARSQIVKKEQEFDEAYARKKRVEQIRAGISESAQGAASQTSQDATTTEIIGYMAGALVVILGLAGIIIWVILKVYNED
jgi:hypothetical protein